MIQTKRGHAVPRQAVFHGVDGETSALETRQSADGSDPHAALRVPPQRANVIVRQTLPGGIDVEAPIAEAVQSAAFGSDPQVPLRVFGQGAHEVVTETVGGGVEPERVMRTAN